MPDGVTSTPALGIGQVGLGAVSASHRAGYRRYGQPLVAGFDPSPEARERFAREAPQAAVHESLDALLDDPAVGVVDVAAPHLRDIRLPVVRAIAAAGKPMLIQKPLASTFDEAVELADVIAAANVIAMVNQNMCFTPGTRPLVDAVMRDRALGEPAFAQITVQYQFDPGDHPWFGKDARWWTGALTVHHLAFTHLLFGPPDSVYAVTGRDTGQPGVTLDGFGHLLLRYRSGMSVAVTSTGTYFGTQPAPHGNEVVWIQGPEGIADWRPDGPLVISRRAGGGIERAKTSWEGAGEWFPDAFGLTMAHLRQALEAGEVPLCSVADNLYVMAVVEAAYRSSAQNRVVRIEEIMGSRWDPSYGTGWSHGYRGWVPPASVGPRG
jgi:predicted dehydrogenase